MALAYAPSAIRQDWETVLLLDARLAGVVRSAREPMLGQMRLAWWRDRLSADPATWPKGEPLLTRLAGWTDVHRLVPMVDGWEAMLSDQPLSEDDAEALAEGRSAGLRVLAQRLGADAAAAGQAARRWALQDLALNVGRAEDRETALRRLGTPGDAPVRLPRSLRPLAVLDKVTARALAQGGREALYRPGSFFTALKVGLFG